MSNIAKVDKKTYDCLMEEPPERWARSCSPRRRYDMLTTNIVESMNSVLLEARELPLSRMIDFIQVKLQRWFYKRRNEAEGTFYDVSCWVEKELKKKIDLAFTLNVFPVDSWHSRVEEEGITFLMDLNKRTCDCFLFQFDELPCIHAISAIEKRNIKKSNFCSHWYLKELSRPGLPSVAFAITGPLANLGICEENLAFASQARPGLVSHLRSSLRICEPGFAFV
uniref:SWIM-type domain-containing protein n=1 Tax=Nicotiana tabacum TaxID=4097 RepID=A0A1S3YUT0_TOBAC|nr:PREDICTED: uncharacterized protein LOC107779780 [Nicotiana tabacum]